MNIAPFALIAVLACGHAASPSAAVSASEQNSRTQIAQLVGFLTDRPELLKITAGNATAVLRTAIGEFVEEGRDEQGISFRLKTPNGVVQDARFALNAQANRSLTFGELWVTLGKDARLLEMAKASAKKRLGSARTVQPDRRHPEAWGWPLKDWDFVIQASGALITTANEGNGGPHD